MKLAKVLVAAALVSTPLAASSAQIPIARTQTIDVTVEATDIFTISTTTPPAISFKADAAAHEFSGGTYSVTTNAATGARRKITAKIATLIPGVTTRVKLDFSGDNATGGTFAAFVAGNTDYDVVNDLFATSASGQAITYEFTAPVTTAATNTTRVVTFTLAAQ